MSKTWLITGVNSGFGLKMTKQLLNKGDTVIGTIREPSTDAVNQLKAEYPATFNAPVLDVTDVPQVHKVVDEAFAKHGKIDVIISNAGYGLFGTAEEVSDKQVDRIIATNLTGSIAFIRSALPHLRRQNEGHIIHDFVLRRPGGLCGQFALQHD